MKRIMILLIVIFLLGCSNGIKKENEELNNEIHLTSFNLFEMKNLKIKSVDVVGVPSEGGLINGYFDEDNIVVIYAFFGGAMNKIEYNIYYYFDWKFVKVTEYNYSAPIGDENFCISSSTTVDYLIYNNEVFIVDDDEFVAQKNSNIIELIDFFEHRLAE